MREEQKDVRLKGKVVETIVIPIYTDLEEAVEALGDVKSLDLLNRQLKADLSNACRAKYAPTKAGKKKLMQLAYKLCDESEHPENYAKMVSLIGDYDGVQAFLESLIPEVEAMLKESA